jgi:predicted DNA-binding protein (MmcQ/YjbR family)
MALRGDLGRAQAGLTFSPARPLNLAARARAVSRPGPARRIRHHREVDRKALRRLCLAFAGAEETFPFGSETSVFKVGGKMFALSQLRGDPLKVSVKCEPPLAEELRAAHPAITPGYHLNKRHWNTVLIDGSLPARMIADMVEDSYDLVVSKLPRARRRALGMPTDSPG